MFDPGTVPKTTSFVLGINCTGHFWAMANTFHAFHLLIYPFTIHIFCHLYLRQPNLPVNAHTGRNCEVNIDDCAGAPCQHGGTCHDEVGAFTCECPAGFEGERCEVNRDECALNVCVHATDCEDLVSVGIGRSNTFI